MTAGRPCPRLLAGFLALLPVSSLAVSEKADRGWRQQPMDALGDFQKPKKGNWAAVGALAEPPAKPGLIMTTPGKGMMVANPIPSDRSNLLTQWERGDLELSLEFLLPAGSNSGVYLQGRYEIQLMGSWGRTSLSYADCGGIYTRWDPARGAGHESFEGHAPRVNGSLPPGVWQRLEVMFRAPRFDQTGWKESAACFVRVSLNGMLVQENVEVSGPTRAAAFSDEQPLGSLMIQGDHGPVAIRRLRYRDAAGLPPHSGAATSGDAPANARGPDEYPLYPSQLSSDAVLIPEEITYRPSNLDDRGFNRVIRGITVPTLTVYRPSENRHRGAAIVICPGGGYQSVVIDREGHAFGRYFQQQGLTAIVLKYRLPQPATYLKGLPVSQQDALAALRFVRAHAAEWGLDPHRIGILGASAGGHLAGSVAVLSESADGSRPDFVALLYPVVCLEGPYVHAGSCANLLGPSPGQARIEALSLERVMRPGLPPFFLAHARDDKGVPAENSMLLAGALERAGVPVELHLYSVGGHGFSLGRGPESSQWMDRFLGWLDFLP